MADAKLNAVVTLSDRMSRPLKGLNKQLRDMQRPFNSLSGQVRQLDRLSGLKGLRQGLAGVARIVGRGGIIGGTALVGGFAALAKSVIDISAQFEKYEAVLTSIEGSNEKAKASMKWVQDFATTTPFQIDAVMQSFVSLKTFGLDPMDGTMQALIDSSAKMGGSQEHLQGIILAVGQAWTKGKLQGEEALQLIERGVPVWDLLAKASGKTAVEMQEMATKGMLGRDAIEQLINAMGQDALGASAEQMKTWNGMMSNLADQWMRFKILIGDSGMFDVLRENLKNLLSTVDRMASNGQLKQLAQSISDMMVSGFETGKAFAKDLIPAMKSFVQWVKVTAPRVASFIDAIGGIKTVAIGVAAVLSGPLLLAVATLGKALLFTPVGLAITATVGGIMLLVKAVQAIIENWEPIKQFFSDLWTSIGEIFKKGLEKIQPIIDTLTNVAGAIATPYKKIFELGGTAVGAAKEGASNALNGVKNFFGGDNINSGNNSRVSSEVTLKVESKEKVTLKKIRKDKNSEVNFYAGNSMMGM